MRIAYQDHGVTLCYILDYTDNIFQLLTIELTLTSTSYINMLFTPNTPQVSDYNVLKVLKKKTEHCKWLTDGNFAYLVNFVY